VGKIRVGPRLGRLWKTRNRVSATTQGEERDRREGGGIEDSVQASPLGGDAEKCKDKRFVTKTGIELGGFKGLVERTGGSWFVWGGPQCQMKD